MAHFAVLALAFLVQGAFSAPLLTGCGCGFPAPSYSSLPLSPALPCSPFPLAPALPFSPIDLSPAFAPTSAYGIDALALPAAYPANYPAAYPALDQDQVERAVSFRP